MGRYRTVSVLDVGELEPALQTRLGGPEALATEAIFASPVQTTAIMLSRNLRDLLSA